MERGRPRSFDADAALDRALVVFWRDGFQGASLAALTQSMGINKPSLYATYGDKASLYLKALARYAECEGACHLRALDKGSDARGSVEAFLRSVVRTVTDRTKPGGCYVVTGTADFDAADMPAAVRDALLGVLRNWEGALKARLLRGQSDGDVPQGANAGELATYFATVMAGLAVQAKGGASRSKLEAVVRAAVSAWPANPRGLRRRSRSAAVRSPTS